MVAEIQKRTFKVQRRRGVHGRREEIHRPARAAELRAPCIGRVVQHARVKVDRDHAVQALRGGQGGAEERSEQAE